MQLAYPAALVTPDGVLIAANPQGREWLEKVQNRYPEFFDCLDTGRPFHLYVEGGLRLSGTPSDDGESVFLAWETLNDTEMRLAMFQAVSRSVNSSLILEEIFDALADVLATFISFDRGTLVILDDSRNSIKVVVLMDTNGSAEIRGDNNQFTGYDPLIAELLENPQGRLLDPPLPDSVLVYKTSEQAVVVPLMSKGVVIGFIGLSGNTFTPMHLALLEDVSGQLAVAVENARLYWQTQSQAGREFLINQLTKAIRQSLELDKVLKTTVEEVGRVMGLSRCLIHYWGDAPDAPVFYEYVLPGVASVEDYQAMAAFERALFERRSDPRYKFNPFVLNDVRGFDAETPVFQKTRLKSLAVFPVLLEETHLVGTISLHQCDAYRAWLPEEIELLKAIAEHVAVALHQARLFQEAENRRRQLEEALQELQQAQMHLIQTEKMAVLGQFVAGIAHEVNTPLGTLMANHETIARCIEQHWAPDSETEKFRTSALELLKINRMAGERIVEIVRNLRNFARLDESQLKRIDLHEGLDATLLLMESSVPARIRVEKDYGGIPPVECFPGLLNQVFMNLLVNAVHSIEGEGTIRIITRHLPQTDQVTVSIADTGKGIAPEHLPRIFDPGFTTKGVGVGTGLGLALCYKIVDKHQGRISVDSTPGKGTTMTVTLPVSQSLPPEQG